MAYKPGEAVKVSAVQEDADGNVISELTWNTYGYDNHFANQASLGIAQTLTELAATLADAKTTGGSVPPVQSRKA